MSNSKLATNLYKASEFNVMESILKTLLCDTQNKILLEIFLNKPFGTKILKRDLDKELSLRVMFSNSEELGNLLINCSSHEERISVLINYAKQLPGDVQRTIRTFFNNYKDYGLKQYGKNQTLTYYWENITLEQFQRLRGEVVVSRNIFKTTKEKDDFLKKKNNKCEICESSKRLAVDHWRAHSIYKIDNESIAVLLCEDCNNIHHNFDASKLLKHKMRDCLCINNWIAIETRIREAGYVPNEEDKKTQINMINEVHEFWLANKIQINEKLLAMKPE
jgi:hypothetical protein